MAAAQLLLAVLLAAGATAPRHYTLDTAGCARHQICDGALFPSAALKLDDDDAAPPHGDGTAATSAAAAAPLASPQPPPHGGTAAAAALAQRVLGPPAAKLFTFSQLDESACGSAGPCAVITTGSAAGTINVGGSTPVEMARGLAHYCRTVLLFNFAWQKTGGFQVGRLPRSLPPLPAPIKLQKRCAAGQPRCYSYYMNVCTESYSAWNWDWARWQQETDWMALSGINLVLSYTGRGEHDRFQTTLLQVKALSHPGAVSQSMSTARSTHGSGSTPALWSWARAVSRRARPSSPSHARRTGAPTITPPRRVPAIRTGACRIAVAGRAVRCRTALSMISG